MSITEHQLYIQVDIETLQEQAATGNLLLAANAIGRLLDLLPAHARYRHLLVLQEVLGNVGSAQGSLVEELKLLVLSLLHADNFSRKEHETFYNDLYDQRLKEHLEHQVSR